MRRLAVLLVPLLLMTTLPSSPAEAARVFPNRVPRGEIVRIKMRQCTIAVQHRRLPAYGDKVARVKRVSGRCGIQVGLQRRGGGTSYTKFVAGRDVQTGKWYRVRRPWPKANARFGFYWVGDCVPAAKYRDRAGYRYFVFNDC